MSTVWVHLTVQFDLVISDTNQQVFDTLLSTILTQVDRRLFQSHPQYFESDSEKGSQSVNKDRLV